MLEFLLGTAEKEKNEIIYRRAALDAKVGKSAFILVPEQFSMYAEEELISKLGLEAQNKIQILTFSRLSNMIFSKLGPLRTKYIDNAGRYLLAGKSILTCKNRLEFFSKNVSQPGFAGLVASSVSEFKRYGISPTDLVDFAKKEEPSVLSSKLLDLAKIYAAFNDLVAKNQADAQDNLSIATEKIPNADFLSGTLYINHFVGFTPTEYFAISRLLSKMDVCVALCTDTLSENSLVFSSQVASYKKLCSIAGELGTKVKEPEFCNESPSASASAELLHLRNNYFSHKPTAYKGIPDTIHISRPQNFYDEVKYAARLIKKLCRTQGYQYSDFLILTGSLSHYELIIPSIFREFEISFFLDQKLTLSESPFMRMILSVLEILAFGFSYSRIMTILRSGFWDISKAETDIFENYILAADISHKQWNSTDIWTYNPRHRMFDMEEINRIKSKTVDKILELIALFRGRKTISEIIDKLCLWLNSLSIYERVTHKTDLHLKNNDSESAEYLTSVWNSFTALVAQISDIMGDSNATFAEFYELFVSCCGELSVGIVPPTQDKVLISEVQRFRATNPKVVIVLGVVDGIFPQVRNSEGIISDAERIRLKELGLLLAPDLYTQHKEDQFLIYSVFTAAKEKLFLLSPAGDSEGKSLGKSEITRRIKEYIFPELVQDNAHCEIDLIEGQESTFHELCSRLFECEFSKDALPNLWKSVYEAYEKLPSYKEKLLRFKNMNSSPEATEISKALAKRLYGLPQSLSVSKLEKYNSCAYSFFMKYGLLAEERLLGGLKPTDTGTILHDVLSKYFEEKSKQNADYSLISYEDCSRDISDLVDSFAKSSDNTLFISSNYYAYMLMRLKSIAASTAWKLVGFYSHSEFRPWAFEVGFGEGKTLPPYELHCDNISISLQGFVDRVDNAKIGDHEYITITDYKSSEKRIDSDMIDAGITIQPLIYANAVSKGTGGKEPAAMLYLQMTDPIVSFESEPSFEKHEAALNSSIKSHGLFLDQPDVLEALDKNIGDKNAIHYINCDEKSRLVKELFEKRLKDAEECALRTAEKMYDGQIPKNPPRISGFDPCSYCPYISLCDKHTN